MIQWLRYVPNGFVEHYEKLGWIRTDALTDTHHDQWSTLMLAGPEVQFSISGEPVKPDLKALRAA